MGWTDPVDDVIFERAWKGVAAQVSARSRQLSRDEHEAQELYQRTAIRAWRGRDSFRGEAAYLTWVMRILEREAARLAAQRTRTAAREIVLDPQASADRWEADSRDGEGSHDTGIGGGTADGWHRSLLRDAVSAGAISEAEHRVAAERLAHPGESWPQIAARLEMTATACAVTHSRAVPKLRVFLFTDRPELIGGGQAIADTFGRVRRDPSAPLTPLEAEAFEQLVIRHSAGYRRRGSQAALRGACAVVARRMGLP
jgi:DNA-directed RNA polymerase specialized sigma24 family protein